MVEVFLCCHDNSEGVGVVAEKPRVVSCLSALLYHNCLRYSTTVRTRIIILVVIDSGGAGRLFVVGRGGGGGTLLPSSLVVMTPELRNATTDCVLYRAVCYEKKTRIE